MPLERELATYARELPNLLLADIGKYAVVGADEVVGTYDTYDDAMKVAYARFGLEPFLVKQVELFERIYQFRRDIGKPCHT